MKGEGLERIITLAKQDSRRGARVVAKVFYRILRKQGFTDKQIINIATNILGCLIQSMKINQNRTEVPDKQVDIPVVIAAQQGDKKLTRGKTLNL